MNTELEKELKTLSRGDLNEVAKTTHGIEDAEGYANAGLLIDEILKKQKGEDPKKEETKKETKKAQKKEAAKKVFPKRRVLYTDEKKKK